jgi:hypothetical protein
MVVSGCPTDDDDDALDDDDAEPTPRAGDLDTSGLPDGRVDRAYSGRVSVVDYDGPIEFTSSSLPDGLEMTPGGSFFGTPTAYGEFELTIVAAGMDGVRDFTDRLRLRILPAWATAPFLGIEHPHLNNLWAQERLFRDPWMRISGGGEDDAQVFVLVPGVYEGGPDGEATGGLGDDVLISQLGLDEVEVVLGEFDYTPFVVPRPPSYPSGHYNEWDPPTYDAGSGGITAGSDTGTLPVEISHPQYGTLLLRVVVAPPDWCPQGGEALCE